MTAGQEARGQPVGPGSPQVPELMIDHFLPRCDIAVAHARVYRVPPQVCYRALVELDLLRHPLIRALINARALLERGGRTTRRQLPPPTFRIKDMPAHGWLLLHETPGSELVLGQIARPWQPAAASPIPTVTPREFAAFDRPGYAKITLSVRVAPYGAAASILTAESRIALTDPDSLRRFRRYWAVVGPGSHLIRRAALRMLAAELRRSAPAEPAAASTPAAPARADDAPRRPEEVAEGVYRLATGRGGPAASNVYFVRSGRSFVLVDAGWPGHDHLIKDAAQSLFGHNARPTAILLTHDHPDHAGSARELARAWDVPVYLHPADLPSAVGGLADLASYPAGPLDRWLVIPLMRALPRRRAEAMIEKTSLRGLAQALDPHQDVPGLPGWRCIPTPGHTPGHVAFFRDDDRVLITGDAVLTVNINSLGALLRPRARISGPPWFFTWNWDAAMASVAVLARLEPRVLAPGHGRPMSGAATTQALRTFVARHAPRPGGSPTPLPGESTP